jgi:hypothetical protein
VDGFLKIWKQHFYPKINQLTGAYDDTTSASKRVRSNPSTPTNILVPASKRARLEESSTSEDKTYDESEMDVQIKKKFLGERNSLVCVCSKP